MKTHLILAMSLAVALAFSFIRQPEDGDFAWRTDLAAAQLEAGEAGLPLLVVFR